MGKILCLIDTLGSGGAERQMLGLAGLLKKRGYDVDLVYYYDELAYAELAKSLGITPILIKVKPNYWNKMYVVRHLIKSGNYKWVIAYKDGPTLICCILRMLGMKFNLVVSERNTTQGISRYDKVKFFLYRWANVIVPNSYSQKDYISKNFPTLKNKVITITNYTDTEQFSPDKTYKLTPPLNILTVARVASQKNIKNYLHAIKIIKDKGVKLHFDWYGNVLKGEETYADECFDMIQKLKIENYIEFHPTEQQIEKRFQQCDIFCLPSNYEGFPNVVCEAMSCKKPILCSRICDNPHIVQEGVNGIMFTPTDPNDIAEKILSMVSMPIDKLQEMGQQSRIIGETLFSRDAFVGKYIKIIQSNRLNK